MIHRFLLISCSVFLLQCARPVADFTFSMDDVRVPASVSTLNLSKNADKYLWVVDDSLRFSDREMTYSFLESGRHTLELHAFKGSKVHTTTKELVVESSVTCRVIIETSLGDMTFELSEETPAHLRNFVELAQSGFYDGLIFHRVIEGFMIQGGDHSMRRTDQYSEPPTIPEEINSELPHYRGALAAARMPDDMNPSRASSGSQFYIVQGRELSDAQMTNIEAEKLKGYTKDQRKRYLEIGGAPQLDEAYTVFGYLLTGYEVLDKIASVKTDKSDKPLTSVRILKVRMLD